MSEIHLIEIRKRLDKLEKKVQRITNILEKTIDILGNLKKETKENE